MSHGFLVAPFHGQEAPQALMGRGQQGVQQDGLPEQGCGLPGVSLPDAHLSCPGCPERGLHGFGAFTGWGEESLGDDRPPVASGPERCGDSRQQAGRDDAMTLG